MSEARAITIRQPWASMIADGLKCFEFRSWTTEYRGTLFIHAGKRPAHPSCMDDPRVDDFTLDNPLPFGGVVAACYLVRIIGPEDSGPDVLATPGWSKGSNAWKLERMFKLSKPVPANGKQGLWIPDEKLERAVAKQVPWL